jgi:hypothetical protein
MDDSNNYISIEAQYIVYQDKDCCDGSGNIDDMQKLVVKTQNGGISEKDDFYVLETKRWAFNDLKELTALLKKFHVK